MSVCVLPIPGPFFYNSANASTFPLTPRNSPMESNLIFCLQVFMYQFFHFGAINSVFFESCWIQPRFPSPLPMGFPYPSVLVEICPVLLFSLFLLSFLLSRNMMKSPILPLQCPVCYVIWLPRPIFRDNSPSLFSSDSRLLLSTGCTVMHCQQSFLVASALPYYSHLFALFPCAPAGGITVAKTFLSIPVHYFFFFLLVRKLSSSFVIRSFLVVGVIYALPPSFALNQTKRCASPHRSLPHSPLSS